MFDCHQAEITVMQFTGNSLPVHQSMSVQWDFTLFHISAKPTYAISSHNCHRNVSLPSGALLWNGMFGRVEGQYTKNRPIRYDEVNGLNIPSNNNYQASDLERRQSKDDFCNLCVQKTFFKICFRKTLSLLMPTSVTYLKKSSYVIKKKKEFPSHLHLKN